MKNFSCSESETNGSEFESLLITSILRMHIMKRKIAPLSAAALLVFLYSCVHTSGTFVSAHGFLAGSSMQGNCMDCHKTGATEGGFIVAGSVFTADGSKRNPNGTIYLHSKAPNSDAADSIIATIEVDGVGNFYTTHAIDLSGGVYPSVTSALGNKAFMTEPTTNGACNSCHGVSTGVITVN